MKIVVIGGSGLIGSKMIPILTAQGHQAISASPRSGVNTLTGAGLAEVLAGADVIVDVSNSPSFEPAAVMEFFQTSTRNLLAQGASAGVGHLVALSVVGTQRLPENGYFRAKFAQEQMIRAGSIPYSIVQVTQFFEFVGSIADIATEGDTVRVPPALIQPIAAGDVAAAVARVSVAPPLNATIEIGGPESFTFETLLRLSLGVANDPRKVIVDPNAGYYGAPVAQRSLVPEPGAQLAPTPFAAWLSAIHT